MEIVFQFSQALGFILAPYLLVLFEVFVFRVSSVQFECFVKYLFLYQNSLKHTSFDLIFIVQKVSVYNQRISSYLILGDPKVTANLYCNFAYLYWIGCVIRSI